MNSSAAALLLVVILGGVAIFAYAWGAPAVSLIAAIAFAFSCLLGFFVVFFNYVGEAGSKALSKKKPDESL